MSEKDERTDDMPVSIFKPEEKYDEKHKSLGEQRQPEHRSSEEGNLVRPERQGMVTYNQNIAKTS